MEIEKWPNGFWTSTLTSFGLLITFPQTVIFKRAHWSTHKLIPSFCSPSCLLITHLVLNRSCTPIFCSNHRNTRLKLLRWIEFQFPERITVNPWEEMDMWQRADVWPRLIGEFHFETKDRLFHTHDLYTEQELEKLSMKEKVGYILLSLNASQLKLCLRTWKFAHQRQKGSY